jgi:hypothetical protein
MTALVSIEVPLSERERAYLDELARKDGLPPGRVLLAALRLYQLWLRYPQLKTRLYELQDAECPGRGGCMGDD